jgi:hypothetical protein
MLPAIISLRQVKFLIANNHNVGNGQTAVWLGPVFKWRTMAGASRAIARDLRAGHKIKHICLND